MPVIDQAGHVRAASPDAGTVPLVTSAQLSQARHGPISVTRTVDDESTRIAAGPLADRGTALAGNQPGGGAVVRLRLPGAVEVS